ncbi:MAG: hypothetical protein NZ561_06875 [Phycisphaerae bacterium]|nr:hypothetical protein [Phycisphaerae bacterium]MDW8262801.1 hypothetical protein [Phycisphaerales bacterium]
MRHVAFCVCSLGVAVAASAHGPQIQITFNPSSGKIESRQIVSTNSAPTQITPLTRVYVMPMLPTGLEFFIRPDATPNPTTGAPLFVSNPGIAYQYESFVPGTGWSHSGSSTLPNLQGTSFTIHFNDALKQWNGTTFIDPGPEQLQMDRGGTLANPAASARTSDTGPFESLPLTQIGAAGANPHHTVRYRLLGDGVSSTVEGDDGVYLATLSVSSSAPGVLPSDPFYYVFFKNAHHDHNDLEEALIAAAALGFPPSQIQAYVIVPEPMGAIGLAAVGGLLSRRLGRARLEASRG